MLIGQRRRLEMKLTGMNRKRNGQIKTRTAGSGRIVPVQDQFEVAIFVRRATSQFLAHCDFNFNCGSLIATISLWQTSSENEF